MKPGFLSARFSKVLLPLAVGLLFLSIWDASVRFSESRIFPKPFEVLRGICCSAGTGALSKHSIP
jgi:ABC-type nitrate/sulfonate/bicarbonate transport system permease component